jgi:hypothetical protein
MRLGEVKQPNDVGSLVVWADSKVVKIFASFCIVVEGDIEPGDQEYETKSSVGSRPRPSGSRDIP